MCLDLGSIRRRSRAAALIEQMAAPPSGKTVCSTAGRRACRLLEDRCAQVSICQCGRDGPNVVWWDPSALALEVEERAALRHQRILELDPDKLAAAESEQDYAAWKNGRADLLSRASQPSISVQTVTALARSEASQQLGAFPPVRVELIKRGDLDRPSGRRFGALVHAMLASVDLESDADAIQASAAVNGRLVGGTEEEIIAAVATVRPTLEHPILRRAAASARKGEIRRETPVFLTLDGGLVEGVVDLAFMEDRAEFAGWTVVDFKTDREFATSSERYTAQVTAYSAAIRAATGLPSRGILLII